jgi:hypothetical protein
MASSIVLRVTEASRGVWEWEASVFDGPSLVQHHHGVESGLASCSELWHQLNTEWWDFCAPTLPLDNLAEV